MPNYQYEILKTIAANGGEIDVETLLGLLTNGLINEELVKARNNIALSIMKMESDFPKYIITNFSPNGALGKYFDQRLWAQEREDEFGISDIDKKITITEDCLIKLADLKEIFDPMPRVSPITNIQNIHSNTGIAIQGSGMHRVDFQPTDNRSIKAEEKLQKRALPLF